LPSQSWWLRFCAQFPQMKLFRAQLLSRGQAHAADSVTLNRFYQLISNVIITTGVSPGQIWAADETVGTAFFIDFALLAGLRFFCCRCLVKSLSAARFSVQSTRQIRKYCQRTSTLLTSRVYLRFPLLASFQPRFLSSRWTGTCAFPCDRFVSGVRGFRQLLSRLRSRDIDRHYGSVSAYCVTSSHALYSEWLEFCARVAVVVTRACQEREGQAACAFCR